MRVRVKVCEWLSEKGRTRQGERERKKDAVGRPRKTITPAALSQLLAIAPLHLLFLRSSPPPPYTHVWLGCLEPMQGWQNTLEWEYLPGGAQCLNEVQLKDVAVKIRERTITDGMVNHCYWVKHCFYVHHFFMSRVIKIFIDCIRQIGPSGPFQGGGCC